ncbi:MULTISPECIES: flagellar motor switch protein FliG [unclassified Erythrobacter]|uniref:flagellar motor switch protein FliG n=1 Tax=unclassified Erythrobacter TaxID=2633097 RepID=UPI00076C2B8F|nr:MULTISPECIES: flagellar motor switch protein FliG [unclassified Erythrobacter]KWV94088.1 flagellar motor switch protein FliG [Erythrobacter sp. AP23]MBO6769455.1 flagellar motor switch protein FliG [Erythrobacter sp.]
MTAPAPRLLGGTDKAAIMVMLLAEEDASKILGQLTPDELRQLAGTMCGIGEIEPQAIADAIAGFSHSTENGGISGHGRVDNVRKLLNSAVGEVKTDNLMRQVAPEAEEESLPALGLLRWLDPKIIGEILADEHPQAIAVLLLQLDTEVAAAALSALPEDLHTPVLHRVARLGPVSRQAIEILEQTLNAKIEQLHGTIPLTMGGIKHAAEIINRSHRNVEKRVLPTIGKIDKQLAKELENEMFKFEHLFALDTKMTGVLLREVESDTLILALKGLEEDQRDQFYGAMSSRAADGLRDEIEMRGRVKKADVETAQKEIVAIAKRLVAQGDLIMGEGDEDYV